MGWRLRCKGIIKRGREWESRLKSKRSSSKVELTREKWRKSFGSWFRTVLHDAEIIDDRYPVKGFSVWKPYGFKLRSNILAIIRRIHDEHGHEEMLFPMLIPANLLAKEATHVRDFEGQSYWVTHGGLRRLGVKLALRPTSETAITPMVKLWARSHADLPKKLYQVGSVFRYETKATKPLLRVREVTTFKEAHTFHSTHEEAEKQIKEAIEIYKKIFNELCVPYIITKRPEWDKFAGAVYSIAFDTVFPDGRTVQIGTVHDLGQNFSRAFDASFETVGGGREYYWQTSYGISERIVAATVAMHGDDHGLVLPPSVAPIQVVIIPIFYKGGEERVSVACKRVEESLRKVGIRAEVDFREDVTPGAKFYEWELRGVPIRIEIGPKDVEERKVTIVKRSDLVKTVCGADEAVEKVKEAMESVMEDLMDRSWRWLNEHKHRAHNIEEAREWVKVGIVEALWCGSDPCGKKLEEEAGAKTLGIPVDVAEEVKGRCIVCGKGAKTLIRIARTY